MLNIDYNLNNACVSRYIACILLFFVICPVSSFAEKTVGIIEEKEPRWYAIAKVNGKKKIYTQGDIFYSRFNIRNCFRIVDIKEDHLVLKDLKSKKDIIVEPGSVIPVENTEIIFEKSIQTDLTEYRYDDQDKKELKNDDFNVIDAKKQGIVLKKTYDKNALLSSLAKEEKELFLSPAEESESSINASLFQEIKIEEAGDNIWSVDKRSAEEALKSADKALLTMIKNVEPRYRFGDGISLRFNSELGDIEIKKEGFLIEDITVTGLAGRAGIEKGDLIKTVNGHSVNSLLGLYRAYKAMRNNSRAETVKIEIIRDEKPKSLFYRVR